MQSRFVLCLLLALHTPIAAAQGLALTFDDGVDPARSPDAAKVNSDLLDNLRDLGVSAAFFPTLVHTDGAEGKALVRAWSEAGHMIGNHTSRHRNLDSEKLALADFIEDVKEAEAAFRDLPTWAPLLRFPYLKEGNTKAKRDGMRAWMASNGYTAAPVSIDTSDWFFNTVFLSLSAARDEKRLAVLHDSYVQHLVDRATYYDDLARKVLGRSPNHVLLLHVNAINAAWLTDAVTALQRHGWSILSPTAAFEDPIYHLSLDVLPAGESIVWSLARTAGVGDLRYPAEDSVYEEPKLRALGLLR